MESCLALVVIAGSPAFLAATWLTASRRPTDRTQSAKIFAISGAVGGCRPGRHGNQRIAAAHSSKKIAGPSLRPSLLNPKF